MFACPWNIAQPSLVSEDVLKIEEEMFEQANEAYEVLNGFEERQVDGLTYEHILTDDEMKKRLECIRQNIPAYQYMNSR